MVRLLVLLLWISGVVLANKRDDHFMIGFCSVGVFYNFNKLGEDK